MKHQHTHQCSCGNTRTCTRPDCHEHWTCPECEDQMFADWLTVNGDQPVLPLDEPTERPLPLEL